MESLLLDVETAKKLDFRTEFWSLTSKSCFRPDFVWAWSCSLAWLYLSQHFFGVLCMLTGCAVVRMCIHIYSSDLYSVFLHLHLLFFWLLHFMHFNLHFLESEKHFQHSMNTEDCYNFWLELLLGTLSCPSVAHSELAIQRKKNQNKTVFPMLRATFISSPSYRVTVTVGISASGSDPRVPMKFYPELGLQK